MRKLKQVLLTCVLGIVAVALSGCGSTTINLNKYVTIETEGYDSMGRLNVTFDYDAFEKDYDGKIKAKVKSSDGGTAAEIALVLALGDEVVDTFLSYCVDYKLDKYSELSNGDVVNFKWNCKDKDAEGYFNVKLKYSDIKYTVKGLTEVGTINPFEYLDIEFSGVSTYGTAVLSQNYDRNEMQYISFSPDKSSELSNGDKVTVTARVQGSVDSFVRQFGAIPNPLSKEYTVEGLQEAGTLNPFEYVGIEFSGASPNGTVAFSQDYSKIEMQYISFSADKSSALSNGDKITVTARVQGSAESFVNQFGVIPSPLSKEFTVEGLPSYVASSSEIEEGTLNAMKQQAEDVYKETWVREDGNLDGLKELTYVGNYFLRKKDGARADQNCIYLVYKIDTEYEGKAYPHYHCTRFCNIMVKVDGSCTVDLNKYEATGHNYHIYPNSFFPYYHGYETLDEMYADCVLSQIDSYTFENNITE